MTKMPADEISRRLNGAAALLKQGRPHDAARELDQILSRESGHAGAHYLRGAAGGALGDINGGEVHLKEALRLDPGFSPAALMLANLMARRGDPKAAADLLDAHHSGTGADGEVRFRAAEYRFEAGELDTAAGAASALLTLSPNDARTMVLLGRIHLAQENPAAAETYLGKALSANPRSATAHFYLSRVHVQRGRLSEAASSLERAAALRPGAVSILQEQARTAYRLNDLDAAIGHLQNALSREPRNASLHNDLAQILYTSGRGDHLETFRQAITQYPDDQNLLVAFAHTARASGENESALRTLEPAIGSGMAGPSLLEAYAQILSELDQHEKAAAAANRAVELPGVTADIRIGRSAVLLAAGRWQEALQAAQAVVADYPGNQLAMAYYVSALEALDRPEATALTDPEQLTDQRAIQCPDGFSGLEDFNAALLARLLELHGSVRQPLHQSVRGGTQVELKPLLDQEPLIAALAEKLLENVRSFAESLTPEPGHPFLGRIPEEFRFSGIWSVRLPTSGHHASHVHPQGWLSSAYYVSVPDDLKGDEGGLNIGKPPMRDLATRLPCKIVRPRAGHLTLFPSYLWHGTVPFTSDQPRVTVAFDIAAD